MHSLRSFLTALWAVLAVSSALADTPGPEASWLETYHNFGPFNEDRGPVSTVFRYVNTGSVPLVILKVRTSCGCTVADYSKRPLAPGDTASVSVVFDPAARLGRFEKTVVVDTNTPSRRTQLTIKGVIVGSPEAVRVQYPHSHGPIAIRKPLVLAGDILKGHVATAFLNAYNQSLDTIRPQIGPTPEWIRISLEPKAIPPGEQASFIIYFHSDRCPEWGLTESLIDITPDPSADTFTLPVVATVLEDFSALSDRDLARAPVISLVPEKLVLEPLSAGAATIETSFRISNKGKSPLIIRRIWSPDPAISIRLPRKLSIRPGKHLDIPCSIDPSGFKGDIINSRITVISNDPADPTVSIRVVAELKP